MQIRKRHVIRAALLTVALISLTAVAAVYGDGPIQEEDANVLLTFTGEGVGDAFGWVGENLGDITGDGVNDVILSAPFHSAPGTTTSGKIYVYSGSDGALLNAFAGNDFEQLGFSATTAGDVNNDGVPDYIAGGTGSPGAPQSFTGRAVVFSGADHSILYDIPGTPGDRFGASVSAAGDLNGDSFDDFLVGANRAGYNGANAGRVYAFSGQDGSVLWMQDGLAAGYFLGTAAGKVGDVTGDGVPDVVVGAVGAPVVGTGGGGRAFVYSGADGSLVFTLTPKPTAGVFGLFFASGAGDVNGDGFP
ncbi:MAG: integrin alpha, partial [Candidatus Promineifilaceae bacterium]